MTPTQVLIVGDGWQRGTLAATRSLGAAGHTVHLAGPSRGHAARSRHSASWHRLPRPTDPGFRAALLDVVAATGADIVFAGDDEHLLELADKPDLGAHAVLGHPAADVVRRALDKRLLYDLAVEAGLEVPEVRTRQPARSEGWIAKRPVYDPGTDHDHVQLEEHDDDLTNHAEDPWMFQRVVEGDLLALVVLRSREGELLYAGAQLADSVYPEPFGVSARAHQVPLPEHVVRGVERLLAELGWWGLAELQFQVDTDGQPHLIDFNGRFFGSLALTVAAGVDVPVAWLSLAQGEKVDPSTLKPTSSPHYQWLEGDLRRALASARPAASAVRALSRAPRSVHSIWTPADVRPAVAHAAELGWWAVRRGARRVASVRA